jgi:hypothetical protein
MPPLSPSDLTFRTADVLKWGAGKGANLVAEEVDLNFWTLLAAFMDIQENPLQPYQIQSIDVTGNSMTITLSDGITEFGPFTLPVAAFAWKGAWQPNFDYKFADFFTAQEGMYLVTKDYTSADTFNPAAGDMMGPFAVLVFPYPNLYDVGFFYPGAPGTGLTPGDTMFSFLAARDFYILTDAPGSVASLGTPCSAPMTLTIKVNGVIDIGTVDFAALATAGTFTFDSDVQFSAGDRLSVTAPDLDGSAKDLNITFAGIKGTIPGASESESSS